MPSPNAGSLSKRHFYLACGNNTSNYDNNRFGGGESVTYTVTGLGLTSASFVFLSAPHGGYGPFFAAAHVQGDAVTAWIEPSPGWELIPEPSSVSLLALAMGIGGAWRRAKA